MLRAIFKVKAEVLGHIKRKLFSSETWVDVRKAKEV